MSRPAHVCNGGHGCAGADTCACSCHVHTCSFTPKRDCVACTTERTAKKKVLQRALRQEREQALRDLGLVKVRGARGGVYWE